MSIFSNLAPAVYGNGYTPIPCKGKRPLATGWQLTKHTAEALEGNLQSYMDAPNLGILTGPVSVIDIDCPSQTITRALVNFIRDNLPGGADAPIRFGNGFKVAILFRAERPIAKRQSDAYLINGEPHRIEILGAGQQFIAYGLHPDTGKPYSWKNDRGPHNTPLPDLPVLHEGDIHTVLQHFFLNVIPSSAPEAQLVARGSDGSIPSTADPLANAKPPRTDLDPEQIADALKHVTDNVTHGNWIRIGQALHHQFSGDYLGLDLWEDWSNTAPNYTPGECRKRWDSFHAIGNAGTVTINSLLHQAKANGWTSEPEVDVFAQTEGTAPGTKPQFRFTPESEMVTKPTVFAIKPLLPIDTIGILFGDSGTYKSFIAIDIGLSIAAGIDWHGNRVRHPGPVFYLAGEGHGGIKKRIEGWKLKRNITKPLPFYVSERPAALFDPKGALEVGHSIKDMVDQIGETPALFIVDTLMANKGGGDFKDGNDITSLFTNIAATMRRPYGACCLVVHHVGHSEKSRESGAYQLRANVDFSILAERAEDHRTTLSCAKTKDDDEWQPMAFELTSVDLGMVDEDMDPITTLVPELTDAPPKGKEKSLPPSLRYAVQSLAEAIQEHGAGGGVHVEKWREQFYKGHTADNAPAKKVAFQRARKDLVELGKVDVENDIYRFAEWSALRDPVAGEGDDTVPGYYDYLD